MGIKVVLTLHMSILTFRMGLIWTQLIFSLLFASAIEGGSRNYEVKSYDRGGRMGRFLGLFTIVSFSDDECNVDGVKGKNRQHRHMPSNLSTQQVCV